MIWFRWENIKNDIHLEGVVKIDKSNFYQQKHLIQKSIDLFHTQVVWDGMFDIHIAEKRILNGEIVFILTYNDKVLGHTWYDVNWWYNIFIDKNRPAGITYKFCMHTFNHIPYDYLIGHTDYWNIKATKLFLKTGATILHPLKVMF